MSLPKNLAALVASEGDGVLPAEGTLGGSCQGARFHSPSVLLVHEVPLGPHDGPTAILCGTCRDNVNTLIALLHRYGERLTWEVRREFGNDLRALAMKGYRAYVEAGP